MPRLTDIAKHPILHSGYVASADGQRPHGAELVGELEQYEDSYRLCYVRGPEGIIIALAEQLS